MNRRLKNKDRSQKKSVKKIQDRCRHYLSAVRLTRICYLWFQSPTPPLLTTSPSPKTTRAKPRRRARRQFPAALHSPNQTLMRSAQIKGGGERRNENSLRPQGRPNPIIPITPANHTLMMGIKMCWPRSSASARQAPVQPSVSGFLRWFGRRGKDEPCRSAFICASFGTAVQGAFWVGAEQQKVGKKSQKRK